MSQQSFGCLSPYIVARRRRRHVLLLGGVSLAAVMLAVPSRAASYTYNDGDEETNPIALSAGGDSFTTGVDVSATISGVVSGVGSFSKLGDGVLTLSGDNTYSGGTNLNAGVLDLKHDNALGNGIVVFNGGALRFSAAAPMTLANDMFFSASGTAMDTTQNTTLTGVMAGTATLYKRGSGTLALSGANTFTGGVIVQGGQLHLLNDNALGTGTLYNSNLASTIGFADGVNIANNIVANAGTYLWVGPGVAAYSGIVSSTAGAFYLSKSGAGELVLTGKVGSSITVNVNQGILTAGAENVLNEGGAYTPLAGATLRLYANQRIAAITGEGTIDLGSSKLEISSGPMAMDFKGALVGDVDAELVKSGGSSLTLSGNGSGYGGRISLQGGYLHVEGDFAGTPVFVTGGRFQGSGTVGDVFIDAGTLYGVDGSTLSMRDLSMTGNTIVDARLGAENATALFDVAGDLTLDGTINVTNVGGFGQGIYRIFTYGGALDDRGLELGTIPEGYDADNLAVQTSVAGQVNVVADSPDYGPVLFWDGDDVANHNNRRVDGGDGVWRRGGNAFTDANGIANGSMYPHPGFVVFTGQAGNVSVVTGYGEIHPDGMQFAVDGYRISGELISWDAGDRIVRVGDGTTAGAGYTAEIANQIGGPGRLVKTDLGTLILSGENAYSGGTLVQDGTLLVNGSILDVEVGVDGRLGGTGTIENDANVLGTLAAGNSIGTLTIEGDLTMAAGSRLEVEVDALGNADRIDVTGVAHLEGGEVVTLASGGDYADATTYTILTAEGGVEGEFEGVSSNLAFLDAALAYGDKDVQLTLTRNGVTYGNVGETRNQVATGEAVEALAAGNGIYDRVLTLSAADARMAFDRLSGEVHASAKGVLAVQSRDLRDAMSDRVGAAFEALGLPEQSQAFGPAFWTAGSASAGSLKSDGNAAGLTYNAGNLFMGADAMFNQDWLLGFAVGYGQTSLGIGDRSSTASSGNYHVGVYGGGEVGDFTFKFGAGYTHHDIKTSRDVEFAGFDETLTAKYNGGTGQVFGEVGHKFRFDSGLIVEPYANLALANVYTGSYAEEGGSAALASSGGGFTAATVTLGVRGSQQFVIGDGTKANVTGAIGWTHTAATTPQTEHAFAGGNTFTVAGAPIQGDSLFLKAGVGIELSENADLNIGYAGQFGSQGQSHGIKGGISVKF